MMNLIDKSESTINLFQHELDQALLKQHCIVISLCLPGAAIRAQLEAIMFYGFAISLCFKL